MQNKFQIASLVGTSIAIVLSVLSFIGLGIPSLNKDDWRDSLLKTTIQISTGTKIGITQVGLNQALNDIDQQVAFHSMKGQLPEEVATSLNLLIDKGQIVAEAWKNDFGDSCKKTIEELNKISPDVARDKIFFINRDAIWSLRNDACRESITSTMSAMGYDRTFIGTMVTPEFALKSELISALLTKLSDAAKAAQFAILDKEVPTIIESANAVTPTDSKEQPATSLPQTK